MSDPSQIVIVYGTARPPAECSVSRELRPVYNAANQITSAIESWTIAGDILPGEGEIPSAALLRTKLSALIDQFAIPGRVLSRQTVGGDLIDSIDPARCLWGPKLADVSLPTGADSVIPIRLPFSIRMEAEVRPADLFGVTVLEYQETVSEAPEPHSTWQGGRFYPGRMVRTRRYPGYRYVQQGRVLTLANSFIIPRAVIPSAVVGDPQIQETSKRAVKSASGWNHTGLEITWNYEMWLPHPSLTVRVNQWPGSNLR